MGENVLELVGRTRAQFEDAKRSQGFSQRALVVIAVVGVASSLARGEQVAYAAAVVSLCATFTHWWYTHKSRRSKSTAERGRRLLLLGAGLGRHISRKETADLMAQFTVPDKHAAECDDAEYFSSELPPGHQRLCMHLQESAFFSKHLFRFSAIRTWYNLAVASSVSVLALLALPFASTDLSAVLAARATCAGLTLLVTANLLGRALDYSLAAQLTRSVDDRLERAGTLGVLEDDLLLLFSDYNAAVEGAPLIPTSIYRKHHDKLKRLWNLRRRNV